MLAVKLNNPLMGTETDETFLIDRIKTLQLN